MESGTTSLKNSVHSMLVGVACGVWLVGGGASVNCVQLYSHSLFCTLIDYLRYLSVCISSILSLSVYNLSTLSVPLYRQYHGDGSCVLFG